MTSNGQRSGGHLSNGHREALQGLGLTQYESAGYLGLLGREAATPAEVARLAGIPRPRVYDVLVALADRGAVRAISERPLRYRAEPPGVVVDRLARVREQETARATAAAQGVLAELAEVHRSGLAHDGPLDYVEVVKDRFKAAARVGELWDTAEREILVLVRPPYIAPPDTSDASVPPGITQRAIYEASILDDPAMVALLHRYAELGEQVRIVDRLPLKLTVIDGRSVAFNMDDPSAGTQSATTVVIHHPELAATLTLAFEALWAAARELPSEIRGGARFEA